MKKKITTILLSLVMVLAMIPMTTSMACATVAYTNVGTGQTYTTVSAAISAKKYNIKLTSNITDNISVAANKTVIIDLNGYVIDGNDLESVVINKGTLTIKDDNTEKPVRYFTDSDSDGLYESYQTEEPLSGEYIKIYGGVITGGFATSGAGIRHNKGTLTLENINVVGNKIDNTSGNANGAGVFLNGTVSVTDCTIAGNLAYCSTGGTPSGAGVYVGSNSTVSAFNNVKVLFNTSKSEGTSVKASGAGLFLVNTTPIKLSGCLIDHNYAINDGSNESNIVNTYGGGIYVKQCAIELDQGTTISNNKVVTNSVYDPNGTVAEQAEKSAFGGGIYVTKDVTLTISNEDDKEVQIVNNLAKSTYKVQGGAIYNGGTVIMTEGNIANNKVEGLSGNLKGGGICNIYETSQLSIAGIVKVVSNTQVDEKGIEKSNNLFIRYVITEPTVTVTQVPQAEMMIGITIENIEQTKIVAEASDESYLNPSNFKSDDKHYGVFKDEDNSLRLVLEKVPVYPETWEPYVETLALKIAIQAEIEAERMLEEINKEEEKEKEETPVIDEPTIDVSKYEFAAKSELTVAPNGKKAVKVTWNDKNGQELDFDGYEIFRSSLLDGEYALIFETENDYYYNTKIKQGEKYFYKVRGYKIVDGEKVYTEFSTLAYRTVK